ncbi:MAG: 50S ribosomal protein L31 [Candidatus Pacebacteria bacterium]|nr:50S ribosomal protein L31 [Candidatus Paceibacterota bacterium]
MKKGTHPKYDLKTKATCACGAIFEVGSTMPSIEMEICSQCHPFYTGNEKIMDTAGRVERFKKRLARGRATAEGAAATTKTKIKK